MRSSLAPHVVAVALVAACASVLSGCTAAPPGRSGVPGEPVTLRVVSGNSAGGIGWDVTQNIAKSATTKGIGFADGAAEVTGADTDLDGNAMTAVRQGKADIGVIRSGRLVSAGAASLAVLQAPMVISNDDQALAIARSDVGRHAMDDLDELGLVGLALAPGGLRHLIGEKTAIRTPADLKGRAVNVRVDAGAEAILAALGARIDHTVGEPRTTGLRSGAIRGLELSLNQAGAAEQPAVLTSNMPIYEKFDVVVVRRTVWAALSDDQHQALRDLATSAIASALRARPTEDAAVNSWCAQNGHASIVATDSEIDGFRAALAPLLAKIESSSGATGAVAQMRALHEGTVDPTGRECSGVVKGEPTASEVVVAPHGDQKVLDGVWRIQVSSEALEAAGATPADAGQNAGVWTFTIAAGFATVDQPNGPPCSMRFRFAGEQVSVVEAANGNDNCGGRWIGSYKRSGSTVTFVINKELDTPIELDQAIFGTWNRIGDA